MEIVEIVGEVVKGIFTEVRLEYRPEGHEKGSISIEGATRERL